MPIGTTSNAYRPVRLSEAQNCGSWVNARW